MMSSDLSLADWLRLLENRHSQEIQLGLERVKRVAEGLGLHNTDVPVITVAGTNGKGSTVASLEAIYRAAGYRVASYTSPHLLVFNERICINQQPITDAHLCAAFDYIEQGRGSVHLTYFETVTLAALWYFKQCKLDLIILEVGMGGRLDATNIIDADLAIITTVDLDHQAYLGDTKELIGHEKAGILRKNRPVIYADNSPPASVVASAQLLNAPLYCLDVDYSFHTTPTGLHVRCPSGEQLNLPLPRINLKAAVAAIIATTCMQSVLPVTSAHCSEAMRTVFIKGRQQVIFNQVTTVLDVAHNPQAALLLADFMQRMKPQGKVHAVFSALQDKDLCGLIKPMHACVDFWYPAVLSGKRAATELLILAAFRAANDAIPVPVCFNNPLAAYQEAMHRAKPGDVIVVYGSFFMVSAIMAANECTNQEVMQ